MNLEINKKVRRSRNIWELNSTLLNNQCVKEGNKREIKNYLKTSENGNTTHQILWDAAKTEECLKL